MVGTGAGADELGESCRASGRAEIWIVVALLALIGVGFAAAIVLKGSGSSPRADRHVVTTTTTRPASTLPAPRLYKVTDGVNVRTGPGTTFKTIGVVEQGHEVLVVCVVDGETVSGPLGSSSQWLRVTTDGSQGYVTALYVDTRNDLANSSIVAPCPKD